MGNKLIKDVDKQQFRNAKKNVENWESIVKMMALFHSEMEREWTDEEKVIAFSEGNAKTHIPSYSTMPGFTCMVDGKYPPCFTSGQCYALYDLRNPAVIDNAVHNTVLILKYPEAFKASLLLKMKLSTAMRGHVEGSFVNVNELRIVNECVSETSCVFMTYEKKYDMVNNFVDNNGELNDRFVLLFSKWEGLHMNNPHNFPVVNVYKTLAEYLEANDEQKCGFVQENQKGEYNFIMGNCADCFLHHVMKDGKGGCFDMEHCQSTAMLAH